MSTSTHLMTVVESARAVREGEISAEELVRSTIARMEAAQSILNCFLSIESERALEKARHFDKSRTRGDEFQWPLGGAVVITLLLWVGLLFGALAQRARHA